MEIKSQVIPQTIETDIIPVPFSEIKQKQNDKKSKYSVIRKNLISITKEDIKNSKELFIKSYKEDLEILNTSHSLNIINTENSNDNNLELNSEEISDLEYSKNKYANKNCSSSNMSD